MSRPWSPALARGRDEAERAARALLDGANVPAGWSCWMISAGERSMGAVCVPAVNTHELLARNLCDQAAVALERMRLATDLDEARVARETEQLRSALLASVSHDLRTPLAAITGSASPLLERGERTSAQQREELLGGVLAETGRLDRYIQNSQGVRAAGVAGRRCRTRVHPSTDPGRTLGTDARTGRALPARAGARPAPQA